MEDEELRPFFEPFGKLVSCIILRDFNKVSKGVAFVVYEKRSEALSCVERGQELIIPGHNYPFVVKMAETKEEKEERKHSRPREEAPPAYGMAPAGTPAYYAPAGTPAYYAPPASGAPSTGANGTAPG